MKKIPLTQNKFALVDDKDFDYLNQWKWCADAKGYAVRSEKRSQTGRDKRNLIRMQREILDAPTDLFVDHINGDKLDNRRINLRLATPSENMRNRKISYNNKSGYKGVWFNRKKQKYVAYIKFNNRSHVLAHSDDVIDAAHIYNQFAEQIFGEFARLNPL